METPVLLLNSSEEILNVITWKKAVTLLFSGKASKPHNFDDYYRIGVSSGYYDLPTVIILNSYIRYPYRIASLTRNNVFKRDRYTCQYCGERLSKDMETIDHVIPRSRKGKHDWNNIVACCLPCNSRKSDRTPEEAGMPLLKQPYAPTKNSLVFSKVARINNSWKKWYF